MPGPMGDKQETALNGYSHSRDWYCSSPEGFRFTPLRDSLVQHGEENESGLWTPYGASRTSAHWSPGSRITLAFMDGPSSLQERVYAAAQQWLHRSDANLSFGVLDAVGKADIRISFKFSGSWSMIGTECKAITDSSRPTMSIGALTETTDDTTLCKVVLHEFGHALGLLHGHKHPRLPFKWERERVYADLTGPPNNWSRERVEAHIFAPFREDDTEIGHFDPKSIMLYPIPAHWTADGRAFPGNSDLSDGDIEMANFLYAR